MGEQNYSAILNELECPICAHHMLPPISQCINGHSICEKCRQCLKERCPICQGIFTEVRNRSLESISQMILLPCTNKKFGCEVKMRIESRKQHELVCKYKTGLYCAAYSCNWAGKYDEVFQHWCSKNLKIQPYGTTNICYMELQDGFYHVNMAKAHGQLFWFQQRTDAEKVYFIVQLIGDENLSGKYFYDIQLGRHKKHLLLSDHCQILEHGKVADPITAANSISVRKDDLQKYCNCTTVTHYRMRIMNAA